MSNHLRTGAVSRTETTSAAAGGCPQSVESAVLRAFEDAFGTPEGRFRYRMSIPYRRSLFFTPNASEDASRTPGSLFEHRMSIPYRRSLFLVRRASENASHLVVRSTEKWVASCCRCGTSNFTKERGRPFISRPHFYMSAVS